MSNLAYQVTGHAYQGDGAARAYQGNSGAVIAQPAGGTSKRRRNKVIRFSDLDERERIEALAAIEVRPFTPLEQAAVDLGEDPEDEQRDDELILMALMRIWH